MFFFFFRLLTFIISIIYCLLNCIYFFIPCPFFKNAKSYSLSKTLKVISNNAESYAYDIYMCMCLCVCVMLQIIFFQDPIEHSFFDSMENSQPKVILIHSESMQVVDAKLQVYKTFKSSLEHTQIFLHHEYEDRDDIAKWSASQKIESLSASLKLTMDSFSRTHLASVIDNALDDSLTQDNIRDICCDVHIKTRNENVGSVKSASYTCHFTFTVQRLKQILVEETLKKTAKFLGTKICNGILEHIKIVVQGKLTEDLRKLRLQISDEIQVHIERSIREIIFEIIAGVFIYIGVFFMTIIYPVDVNSREWRHKVADEVFKKINENRIPLTTHILEEIICISSKTVDDFENILTQLTIHRTETFSIDQKQCKYKNFEKKMKNLLLRCLHVISLLSI